MLVLPPALAVTSTDPVLAAAGESIVHVLVEAQLAVAKSLPN